MTKQINEPRAHCGGVPPVLRAQLAIFSGLLARLGKAYAAGAVSAKSSPHQTGDTVLDNFTHMESCLESIAVVLERMRRSLKAGNGVPRPTKHSSSRHPYRRRLRRKCLTRCVAGLLSRLIGAPRRIVIAPKRNRPQPDLCRMADDAERGHFRRRSGLRILGA